jgi:hypothetical protein
MILRRPLLLALLVSAFAFIVYQFTIAPGISFIDAGELATDCYTLGIAHPTGYPLFTLVGFIIAHLPFGSVIFQLNEMAALFTALGAGSLFLLSREIFAHWFNRRVKAAAQKPSRGKSAASSRAPESIPYDPEIATIAAVVVALVGAFSETWWEQSTSIEVYPIHLFLIPLALLFFLRMLRKEAGAKPARDGFLFAATLGLAFTNHLTTVLLAPATMYAFFACYGLNATAFKRIVWLAGPFLGTLLIYLYLPLRSAQYPLMDWGHPADLTLFLKHVTGGQYKIWMFKGGSAGRNWKYFFGSLDSEFSFIGRLLSLLGIVGFALSIRPRRVNVLVFSLLLFFGCLLYAINYDIHDIDSYFLLAYITYAIWIGAGLLWLSHLIGSGKFASRVVQVGGTLFVLMLLALNYSSVDESGNHMVDDYTQNQLRNLPPNAIIFSAAWDFWVSGAFYYQNIQKFRPDVLVVDRAMLRDRPWYFEYLKKRAPDVMARVAPETQAFLQQLKAFDRGDSYSGEAISAAYSAFTTALVECNQDRPIFMAQDLVGDRDELFAPAFHAVPAGIAYRLVRRDTLIESQVPQISWNDVQYRKRSYYTDNARLLQAMPLAAYAEALAARHDYTHSSQWLELALKFTPDLQATLSHLPVRDREFGEETNTQFERLQQFRNQLRSMQ